MMQTEFNIDYEMEKKNNYPMHVPRSRGVRCRRRCHMGVRSRVIRSLAGVGPFAGDRSFAGDRLARLKEKCRWAGLGVSALDWACGSRVEAIGLGHNWAYAFWA